MEIKNALIVVNRAKEDASEVAARIEEYLSAIGVSVDTHGYAEKPGAFTVSEYDVAFSLGGDGTVLYCSRLLGTGSANSAGYTDCQEDRASVAAAGPGSLGHPPGASRQRDASGGKSIPIFAVNVGDFGFITEVSKDEWKQAFEKFRNGKLGISERVMVETTLYRGGEAIEIRCGLNDVVIASAGTSKVVRLSVDIGETTLGRYRADGVIIATPTGSTAYSVAAGGPILAPEMDALILNPICPFTLSNRPLVLPGDIPIHIGVEPRQRTDVVLTVDGQETVELAEGDRLKIKRADTKARIVRSDRRNFYEVLRSKLNWSGGPDA